MSVSDVVQFISDQYLERKLEVILFNICYLSVIWILLVEKKIQKSTLEMFLGEMF